MITTIRLLKGIFWFLLISSIAIISCDGKKHPSMADKMSTKKTLKISSRDTIQAVDLFDFYLQSLSLDREMEAQSVLKGKKFYIKGRIKMPDEDLKDRLGYVQLKAHKKDDNTLIICRLTSKIDQEMQSKIVENTSVILFGEYIGYTHFPNMKDCHLISVNPPN